MTTKTEAPLFAFDCPKCHTSYEIEAEAFQGQPQDIQCDVCGSVWSQPPPSPSFLDESLPFEPEDMGPKTASPSQEEALFSEEDSLSYEQTTVSSRSASGVEEDPSDTASSPFLKEEETKRWRPLSSQKKEKRAISSFFSLGKKGPLPSSKTSKASSPLDETPSQNREDEKNENKASFSKKAWLVWGLILLFSILSGWLLSKTLTNVTGQNSQLSFLGKDELLLNYETNGTEITYKIEGRLTNKGQYPASPPKITVSLIERSSTKLLKSWEASLGKGKDVIDVYDSEEFSVIFHSKDLPAPYNNYKPQKLIETVRFKTKLQ